MPLKFFFKGVEVLEIRALTLDIVLRRRSMIFFLSNSAKLSGIVSEQKVRMPLRVNVYVARNFALGGVVPFPVVACHFLNREIKLREL